MIGALLLATDLCLVGDELATAHGGLVVGERSLGVERRITGIASSPDGRFLAEVGGLAGSAGRLTLWEVASGQQAWTLEAHADLIYDVAWSPDGRRLYTASADGTVGRFSLEGEALEPLAGHSSQVLCLAVAPDGTLASGSLDRTVRIWRDGQVQRSLDRHAGAVNALAFAPDGQQLASAAADGTVRIWQHAIGRQRKIIDLERGRALAVLWSERGLFAGSDSGAVCELDWLRAQVASQLGQHDDWVRSLVVVDGHLVSLDASGGQRSTVLAASDAPARAGR